MASVGVVSGALDLASGSQTRLLLDVRTSARPCHQHGSRCCWTGSCHLRDDAWADNDGRWLSIRWCEMIAPRSRWVEGRQPPATVQDRLGGINHLYRALLKLPGECSNPAQAWHVTNMRVNTHAGITHSREAGVAVFFFFFTASGNLLNSYWWNFTLVFYRAIKWHVSSLPSYFLTLGCRSYAFNMHISFCVSDRFTSAAHRQFSWIPN